MRCTPTIHDLIVLTLPPRHRCPLDRMPASRLLLPRSGLERSDFVRWHFSDVTAGLRNVCRWGKSGSRDCVARLPSLTRNGSKKARSQKRELMFSNGQR
jgi:hypothetical protein